MVVLILERVPASLRGELSRWMIEPKTGVFVGSVSGMVRDKLWEMAAKGAGTGAALMLHTTNNEQGFGARFWGATSRKLLDFEGMTLVCIPEGKGRGRSQQSQQPS